MSSGIRLDKERGLMSFCVPDGKTIRIVAVVRNHAPGASCH
ncbi:MAG TPA: hypothetical protein PKC98_04935 [Candidatus Melainabacteria bacterium]|nr:hypothetical protein [Candidatus Melainabacteria bacterium]